MSELNDKTWYIIEVERDKERLYWCYTQGSSYLTAVVEDAYGYEELERAKRACALLNEQEETIGEDGEAVRYRVVRVERRLVREDDDREQIDLHALSRCQVRVGELLELAGQFVASNQWGLVWYMQEKAEKELARLGELRASVALSDEESQEVDELIRRYDGLVSDWKRQEKLEQEKSGQEKQEAIDVLLSKDKTLTKRARTLSGKLEEISQGISTGTLEEGEAFQEVKRQIEALAEIDELVEKFPERSEQDKARKRLWLEEVAKMQELIVKRVLEAEERYPDGVFTDLVKNGLFVREEGETLEDASPRGASPQPTTEPVGEEVETPTTRQEDANEPAYGSETAHKEKTAIPRGNRGGTGENAPEEPGEGLDDVQAMQDDETIQATPEELEENGREALDGERG